MADISNLSGLQSTEPLNLPQYKEAQEFRLPVASAYTLRAPESFTFDRSKAGFLTAQIDPTIVGPTNEGFTLRFTRVSAKTFEHNGQMTSQLGRYLKAAGVNREISGEPQAQADAVEETAGRTFEAYLDWRVFNPNTGFKVEGMTKFPRNSDGSYQSWVVDPDDIQEDGTPKRLRANLYIKRFISSSASN